MKSKLYYIIVATSLILFSCTDFLTPPERAGYFERDYILEQPDYAYGILLNAYSALPNDLYTYDIATDNATTNSLSDAIYKMGTGSWTSSNYPMGSWSTCYKQLKYIHLFQSVYKDVKWEWRFTERNPLFIKRMTGEIFGLRAFYHLWLLQTYAGIGTNGELLGIPLVLKELTENDDLRLARNTFDECVAQIVNDCDSAAKYLPLKYVDVPTDPTRTAVFGEKFDGLLDKRFVMMLKSRATLLAASPAFSIDKNQALLGEKAAVAAADLIKELGGEAGFSTTLVDFYAPANFADKEILFRYRVVTNNTVETNNYPPSLFGKGFINPSQNLVDAMPNKKGYPAANDAERVDYVNKDLRFQKFIVYDLSKVRTATIQTSTDATTNDGLGKAVTSTRTGYYMRKYLNEVVNLSPSVTGEHFITLSRATEVFLNYAEAVNQVWGPNDDHLIPGLSPKKVLQLIRKKAGIDSNPTTATIYDDAFLDLQASAGKEAFHTFLKNERRIELCFENNFRFWDLRRWKDNITEPLYGVSISTVGGKKQYSFIKVDDRPYETYMYYPPIPYGETAKYQIIPNKGWQAYQW